MAASTAAPAGKSGCIYVKKKVHGKTKRVKVCEPVKPAPSPTPTPSPTPAPATDIQAHQLVDAITSAGSTDARKQALVALFGALHVGVYSTTTGRSLVRGTEVNTRDYLLYDYELTLIAGSLARYDTNSLANVAQILTNIGIKPKGQPVDPEFVRRMLIALVQGALTHTSDQTDILPLVIRELGLRHAQPDISVEFERLGGPTETG